MRRLPLRHVLTSWSRRPLQNALAEKSVHVVTHDRQGSRVGTYVEDVAANRGRQVIRIGGMHAEVIVIGHRAYITGNGDAMVNYFGLPRRLEAQLAGRWLLLTPVDDGYPTVSADVTIESNMKDLAPASPLQQADSTLGGAPVLVVSGGAPKALHAPPGPKEALYISTGSHSLPVRATASAPNGGLTSTTELSRWGEPVLLSAPAHAIPISKALGKSQSA